MKKIAIVVILMVFLIATVSCGKAQTDDKFYFEHVAFKMEKLPTWYQTENKNVGETFDAFFEKKSIRNKIVENIRFNIYVDSEIITINDEEFTLAEMIDGMKVFYKITEELESIDIAGFDFYRYKFVSYPDDGVVPYIVTIHSAIVNKDHFIITTGTYTTQPVDEIYTEDQLIMFDTMEFIDVTISSSKE